MGDGHGGFIDSRHPPLRGDTPRRLLRYPPPTRRPDHHVPDGCGVRDDELMTPRRISTVKQAADDGLIVAFGRLLGAANRLEYILGRALERECGISHVVFEVLLILGRAGGPGLSMRVIAQSQVLTTGGATRLVDRMEAAGLVERVDDPDDRRGRLVRLTREGEKVTVAAARVHVRNIERYFVEPLPAEDVDRFADDLRILSHSAQGMLPRLP